MWAEARKHDQSLKRMMADHKRSFEKRQEHMKKLKRDPINYLCVTGQKCKLHYDPVTANMMESSHNMMPFLGDANNLIDRFDGRAHLDRVPEYASDETQLSFDDGEEERTCNYERYRAIIHNAATNLSEENALKQIETDEFRAIVEGRRAAELATKASKQTKPAQSIAIPFSYDDDASKRAAPAATYSNASTEKKLATQVADSDAEATDSDEDEDLKLDIDVDAISNEQLTAMNRAAIAYGLPYGEFTRFLREDKLAVDERRMAKQLELEKASDSYRKRIDLVKLRDANFVPSYALDESASRAKVQTNASNSSSSSASDSDSDASHYRGKGKNKKRKEKIKTKRKASDSDGERIEFITTFGEEEPEPALKTGTSQKRANTSSNGASAVNAATTSSSAATSTSKRNGSQRDTGGISNKQDATLRRTEFDRTRRTQNSRTSYRVARSSSESSRESKHRSRDRRTHRRSPSRSRSRDRRSPRSDRHDSNRSRHTRTRRSSTSRSRSRSRSRSARRDRHHSNKRRTRDSRSRSRSQPKRGRRLSRSNSPTRKRSPVVSKKAAELPAVSNRVETDVNLVNTASKLRVVQTGTQLQGEQNALSGPAVVMATTSATAVGTRQDNVDAPLKRYRRVDLEKEDEDALRLSSDEREEPAVAWQTGLTGTLPLPPPPRGADKTSSSVLKVAELLRRKTETSIAKSFKAQQHAEREKQRKVEREQLERDAEMRRRREAQRGRGREWRRRVEDRDEEDDFESQTQTRANRHSRRRSSSRSQHTSSSSSS